MTDLTNLLKIIGANLYTVRHVRKETLQGVAGAIGITHPVLSKIENGRNENLAIALLVKLCNYYEVSLQQMLSPDGPIITPLAHHHNDGPPKPAGGETENGLLLCLEQYRSEVNYLILQVIDKK